MAAVVVDTDAAVAVVRGVPLVTNNPGHYAGVSSLQVVTETG